MADVPTRGERNNNCGNIDFRPDVNWVGQVGLEIVPPGENYRPRFIRFDVPVHGIRAIAKLLRTYIEHAGCNTIRKAISRWAPLADNNDTEAYIRAVAAAAGVDADQVITATAGNLVVLTRAIIRQENGRCIYDPAVIAQAVGMAME